MKTYIAKTKKGSFEVTASNVKEAWGKAKQEEAEINKAREEVGWFIFNYRRCKVIRILYK